MSDYNVLRSLPLPIAMSNRIIIIKIMSQRGGEWGA